MKNAEIRKAMKDAGIKQLQLAELMGISENTIYRRLRTELPDDEKQRILNIIRRGQ